MKAKARTLKNGERWVRGYTRCVDCDRPITYDLQISVALMTVAQSVALCESCLWSMECYGQRPEMILIELP